MWNFCREEGDFKGKQEILEVLRRNVFWARNWKKNGGEALELSRIKLSLLGIMFKKPVFLCPSGLQRSTIKSERSIVVG